MSRADLTGDEVAAVRDLLDREAIRKVYVQYARGINRADRDILKSIYHEDAYVDHGNYRGPASGYATTKRGGDAFPVSSHNFAQADIQVDGDTAHSEMYCIFYYVKRNDELERLRAGVMLIRYLDRLERRDGRNWRIAFRRIVLDYSHEHDLLDMWPDAAITTEGLRTRDDLSYHWDRWIPGDPLDARH
jgi:SnoaL-like domain